MSLHITPDTIEAQYVCLCTTLPFKSWKLPAPDDLEFRVLSTPRVYGHFRASADRKGVHEIGISFRTVGSLDTLTKVLAHEMVHMKQEMDGTTTANTEHNAQFRRLCALVSRHHCFDPKAL